MATKNSGAWSVLSKDGRVLARGMARKAASALMSWVASRRDNGADDDEIRRELRGESDLQTGDGVLLATANGVGHVLDQPVASAHVALDHPSYAPHYRELLEAEHLGANRKSMVAELQHRDRDEQADKILEQTIPQLTAALTSGMHDDELRLLLTRESHGKDRKGARAAIESRMQALACIDVLDGTLEDLDRFLDAGGAERHAQAMLDAERNGKARVGAVERLAQVIAS